VHRRYRGTVVRISYGSATGPIWLDDVQCVGTETSIADCSHRGWGVHNCDHTEDVSVSCGTSPVQHGTSIYLKIRRYKQFNRLLVK